MPGRIFEPSLTMLGFHRLCSVICEKTFHITNLMTQLHSYLPKMAAESESNEDKNVSQPDICCKKENTA